MINRKDLSLHDKKRFYKQISGATLPKVPTIIRAEEIFIDEEYVHIVQEYMECSLKERLQKHKDNNEFINSEQVNHIAAKV